MQGHLQAGKVYDALGRTMIALGDVLSSSKGSNLLK